MSSHSLLTERLSGSVVDTVKLERTLERAARFRHRLSRTDEAVALVREGRDELERRAERR
ncbi:MAG TPA: hypothetical protein VIJ66_01140 [Solirubrobacteraceae bacterium]